MNASGPGATAKLKLIWKAIQVRFRFVVVLLAASLIVGNWEMIRNRGEATVRRFFGSGSPSFDLAVSTDTEYFCPMDPGILSDWPGRCGACNMTLVRRKKGDSSPRPDGVIARMQFSPYRIQLAGLQTGVVDYRPLASEVTGVGSVVESGGKKVIRAEVFVRDLATIAVGQTASIQSDDQPTGSGRVVAIESSSCLIEVGDVASLQAPLVVKIQASMAERDPFRSMPANPPRIRKGEHRTLYACPEHSDQLKEAPGRCPIDRNVLEPRKLADNQRVGWWCPMHPSVTADASGSTCKACEGMALVPRVISYRPPGEVLAVPESAVVDSGVRRVVFLERMPGMFDAVEVELGPRCGANYPVISGLKQGDRVATSGSLLLDAESRLDPGVAAAYFGASARSAPTKAEAPGSKVETCPVTGKALGSMGAPVRVEVEGKTVWICCAGCEAALRRDPGKYLSRK
jgi:hypothetical protein